MKVPGVYLLDREMDCRPQPLRDHAGGRARRHPGSGHSRRGQSCGADRSHSAPGRASAHGRGRRGSVHSHRRRDARRLRGHGAPRGRRNRGSASRFPCISTKPPPPRPSARIWRTSAAASSKAFATRSPPTPRAARISASRACIPRRARPWWARANFSSPTTCFSIPPMSRSPKKSPRPCAFLPAACGS